jgi:hypothetical protein
MRVSGMGDRRHYRRSLIAGKLWLGMFSLSVAVAVAAAGFSTTLW